MKFLYIILGALLAGLVFFMSLSVDFATPSYVPYLDKLIHFIGYGLVAFCITLLFFGKKIYTALFCGVGLLAVSTELLQMFAPGRTASWQDLLANVVGIIAGTIMALVLRWLYENRLPPKELALVVFNYLRKL